VSAPPFVHLHCHSHYSLLDGASPIKGLVARAKELGMNALAITDHGNLYGAVEFYKACQDAGINPVLGYEAYVAPGSRFDKSGAASSKEATYHLTLLAKNAVGFRNLVKLASRAFLEGFYHKPRIDRALLEQFNEGLICLSGCVSGEFSRALLAGAGVRRGLVASHDEAPPSASASGYEGGSAEATGTESGDVASQIERARQVAAWFHGVFGDRYFIEIQDNGLEIQRLAKEAAVEVARHMGLPLVATSDAHYVRQEDAVAQDVLLCINTGKFRTDANRMRMEGDQFYLRSAADMLAAMPDQEEALRRSQEIADSVHIDLELGRRHFPSFAPPQQKSSAEYLRELCEAGLRERYADRPDRCAGGELSQVVRDRLERELSVIGKLGFNDYFLIVWDFVRFAVERGIPSTARGSGVGSLVCYALRLSHVCPLDYDLLFERFLDEDRLEAPDIDIDFCKDRRGEVIQYVKDKYGEANVAQIGTFGTLAARAAIRDVGRTLGMPVFRVDQVVSMVPDQLGISLDKALLASDELRQTYDKDPEIRELIDLARKIEGLARNVGTHAAAVVIAEKPVDEYVPLQRVTGKTEVITQWAMGDVEAAGLLKMDFLGLRNLTILARSVELIEQSRGVKIDPYKFPLDDPETFALLCRGETKGIFQLESGGIRDLLQRMKPDHFRDVIATNALYRPGPLEGGMVDQYIEVKHGRKQAEYPHPVMAEILAETHGVMVYQEQVMRILNRLGGIQLSNAYTCIKAISKKKLPIIARYREEFIAGAKSQGLDEKRAVELFGMIEKFAGYGFNKCVVGETQIVDADSGERTAVETLFRKRDDLGSFRVHSLGEDGKLRKRRVTDVVWNGKRRVYRVETALGHVLTATGNHPLRTFGGWTHVDQLNVSDRIAAPRTLPIGGDVRWDTHEVVTLAGLLSEGNTCHPTCLYFYNNDPELVEDFVAAVEKFPETRARVALRRGTRREVCVSTGRDARFRSGSSGAELATNVKGVRSGAFRWAAQLGILGKRAAEKSLPADAHRLSVEQTALLLGRLWSGDGFVGAAGQMPYYATSSIQLAYDVQTLLLRLGVVSRVSAKSMRYRYKGETRVRSGYSVHLVGDRSVRTFVDCVGPSMVGRDRQLTAYREYLASVAAATSKDTIPPAISRVVDRLRREAGLGWRQLEVQSGVSMRDFCRCNAGPKRGFRRSTIAKLAKFFESDELAAHADSDVFWDRVVSIEPAGVADVYDLTVEEDHNFVADGLVVHNSHSTAYALIAYMTAYLKAHYQVEFMAALLSCDIPGRNFKSKDSLVEHLEDCRRMGVDVLPPDANASQADFAVIDGRIRFGLAAIKACGGAAAEAIAAERRAGGPFASMFDFCERLDAAVCNRAAIEALVKAGAFDSFGGNRAQLLAVLDKALQSGAAAAADRRSGQRGLFDDGDETESTQAAAEALPNLPPWDEKAQLAYEKEVLGFYLSSHPLAEHEATLRTFCTHTAKTIGDLQHRDEVLLGGMLAAIKYSHTKNPRKPGDPTKYAMWDLEDLDGIARCIMWPEQFAEFSSQVAPDAILAVRGKIDRRPGAEEVNVLVDELIPLADLSQRFASGVTIRVRETEDGPRALELLREILRGYPGHKKLRLRLDLADGSQVWLDSGWPGVDVTGQLRERVEQLLGPASLSIQGARPRGPQKSGPPAPHNGRRRGQAARS
jgi:DNA polymerase-3 subunit alpha